MLIQHRFMTYLRVPAALAALLLAACTKSNPNSCTDGSCTDPALPFCDTDGALEGEAQTCVAVDCTPGDFKGCRADTAIVCNDAGGDYDLVQCEKGCDEGLGGCRLCEPNQTACTNGKVAICDGAGKIVSTETCALGCFEDKPRCREIDPSNNLAAFLDMVDSPPDLDLSLGGTIRTESGEIQASGQVVLQPTFLVPPSGQ